MQRPWQHPVPHRHHHLDHAGHPGRRLGVADVGLDRPEPQRPVRRTVLAVGRKQRLRLDRIAQRRAGAVRLDRVDLVGGQPARSPAPARITRCCEGPLGAVSPLLAPSWLTALPRTTASTRWPWRRASRQPLQQQHADALAPAGAVRCVRERLAASVGRQPALAAELDERRRGGTSPSRRRRAPGRTRRERSAWQARCSATSEEEQAVSTVTAGPSSPKV